MTATRIERDPVFGCELVLHPRDRDGYGRHGRELAHVVRYRLDVGPIGDGLVIDHLCRRRNCQAPHHLEAVTQSENEKRKSWRYRAKRALCARGHDLKINAMVTPEGGRLCRMCIRETKGQTT